MSVIGFVILSHGAPAPLLRLVGTLNAMYDAPPIAIHHDFGQAPLDERAFPGNVRFVRPHLRTEWAKWSLVAATLAGIELLYAHAAPDWFTLLSAADYPISPAATVLADLRASKADVLIDLHEVLGPGGAGRPPRMHGAHGLYVRARLKLPMVRFRPPLHSTTTFTRPRLGARTITLPFAPPSSPFGTGFRCYVGSQWFTARAVFADRLIRGSAQQRRLARYLRSRVSPDECFFQSLAGNDADLRVDPDPRRLVKWDGGAHPSEFGLDDLDALRRSGDHFARKFGPDMALRDRLDALNGIRPS